MVRLSILLALLAGPLLAQAQSCNHRLLVSGYFSSVHVFDACTGAYERLLDDQNRIRGAQATRLGPDGKLYVVSEDTGQILRYNPATLAYEGVAVTLPANFGATGLDFRNGEIFVGGYNYDGVQRYRLSDGGLIGDAFARNAQGLNGPDNGLVFGPDGRLYVPGFDSDSVIRFDPISNAVSGFIAARAGTLDETRGILFEPGGTTLLVSSERNGKVLRFGTNGNFIGDFATGLARPTGLAYHPDGSVLITHVGGVSKHDPATGAARGLLADASLGGVSGPTWVTVIPKASNVDTAQVGTQYWIAGLGNASGRTLIVDASSASGATFGSAFNPAAIARKRWGSLRIDFTSCTEGQFTWQSSGADSARFGDGGYRIERLIVNEATQRCQSAGFANANDLQWIVGTWYGGSARDGEGLMIDKTADGRPFIAWFTHRP